MNHELTCTWLGLPADGWPPNHYTLLGLEPGESDPARIEQHVQERLERLRNYQLAHPDQVTEAMNRVARAFLCLTDPEAKKAYDALLLPVDAAALVEPPAVPAVTEVPADPLAWLFGPWSPDSREDAEVPATTEAAPMDWATAPPPARLRKESDLPDVPLEPPDSTNGIPAFSADGAAASIPAALVSPSEPVESAAAATRVRRGLGTKRALYRRILRTRQILRAWEQAGKYLGEPTCRLKRRTEAIDLVRQLAAIRRLLPGFPLLGGAEQPGYPVIAFARLPEQLMVPTFQTLLHSQREFLAQSWQAGRLVLTTHRRFLRQELRAGRRPNPWRLTFRATWAAVYDHPGLMLLLVALAAVILALR